MTRKQALHLIRVEFAQNGPTATREALRYYVENRISREAFNQVAAEGIAIYNRRNGEPKGH